MLLKPKVKNVLKKKKDKKYEFKYLSYIKKEKINDQTILMESTHGNDFSGHMFYICKSFIKQSREQKIIIAIKSNKQEWLKTLLKRHDLLGKVEIVEFLSDKYMYALATSKYLINDTSFWAFFNKRPEQLYINIWHGTPLKCLGKDMSPDGFGNVQKNFLSADYLVVSNEYTKDKLVEGYFLKDIASTKLIVGPSPRNSILHDLDVRQTVRDELGINNKRVLMYMPTYRDNGTSIRYTEELLSRLDKELGEKDIVFVKLHPFDAQKISLNFSNFKKIHLYPEKFETYEFLTAVDTLITDYSSIMYDFFNTGRELVLYTYDKIEYYAMRGLYEDISDYPIPQTDCLEDLIKILNSNVLLTSQYPEDFLNKYISYDYLSGSDKITSYLLDENKNIEGISEYSLRNDKENVVIYAGQLWDNGITKALLNTLGSINLEEKNYILYVKDLSVKYQHKYKLEQLPIHYVLSSGITQYNIIEGIITYIYLNTEWFGKRLFKNSIEKIIHKMYRLDFRRIFNNLEINQFMHYTGFERAIAAMMNAVSDDMSTVIFYHTDIFQEYKAKKNVNMKILKRTYELSDKLAIVNKELEHGLIKSYPHLSNIVVLNNFLGHREIVKASKKSLYTSLLDAPLQYGNSSSLFSKIALEEGIDTQTVLPIPKKMRELVYRNKMGSSSELPFVSLNVDLICESLQKDSLNIMKNVDNLQFTAREIGHIYGANKLKLIDALLNPDMKVFINIGRFAIEKGHGMLIDSFSEVHSKYPNTMLIIVAPHGPLRNQTISKARNSEASENIIILGGMANPYVLLKYCDAFILSSSYEGLGLVVFEALAVGTDVITVDIPATTSGLKSGAISDNLPALIVDNSLSGLTEGILNYLENEHHFGGYDFDKEERISLSHWDAIVKNHK